MLRSYAKSAINLCNTQNWLPIVGQRCYSSAGEVKPIAMAFDEYGEESTEGNKFPLIIMHGLMGSKQNWRGIGRILANKLQRKIFAVDARNHGESPHSDVHNSAAMAADVKAFMAARKMKRATVVGHSMGGRTMMYFTLKYPQLVLRSIIVDISPSTLPNSFSLSPDVMKLMHEMKFPKGLSPGEARQLATKQLQPFLDKDTISFLLMNLKRNKDEEFYWMANLKVLSEHLHQMKTFEEQLEEFPPFKGPVHFIIGSKSEFFREDDWPVVKKFFPAADNIRLNAGHLVHFEQPEQFVDAVVDFVQH